MKRRGASYSTWGVAKGIYDISSLQAVEKDIITE
jgi:hypothetical protein